MKIFDVVPFFNETMILNLRINILDPWVDFFIINESPFSFTGNNKPLFYDENKHLFKKFEHKIIHHIITENDPEWNQWERELVQKSSMVIPLQNIAKNEDVVVVSDCDEIPDLSKIDLEKVSKSNKLYICHQLFYYYYFNTLCIGDNNIIFDWQGSRLSSWQSLRRNSTDTFRNPNSGFSLHSPHLIEHVQKAGWHFTFLNTPENVQLKIKSWSHQEFNTKFVQSNVADNMKNLKDVFYRNQFKILPIPLSLETHPKFLLDHISEYNDFIYKT